ncbi:MAG TPA: c-type cytochrome [Stellaceae bacterium]|jgi:mono/diheme cytochrome c family protein|nr:c-type cytochrome [Stellaceae bacterium]
MRLGKAMHRAVAVFGTLLLATLTTASASAESLRARGAYLVNTIAACGNCHTPKDAKGRAIAGKELSGGFVLDIPPGRIVAPNITPDLETGIGKWSPAQIVTALREGKRPDGRILGPPMPFEWYRQLSDRDAAAIAAYVRGVAPVRHAVEPSQFKIPLPPSYGPPVGHVEAPPTTDKIAYGGYLAGPVGHCMECHTPFAKPGELDMSRLGAGGQEFPAIDKPGATVVSRNITPDPDSGLGKWSDADIKRAIRTGIRPDGTKLVRTMAFDWYAKIAPSDLDAIVAYLRSLKPLK